MKFFSKMERKFGRFAIHNLMLYITILYAAGYVVYVLNPQMFTYLYFDAALIMRGQVWRLVTFMMVPLTTNAFMMLLICYMYYMLGTTLERTWGAFRFNVYVFMGIIGTILGAMIVYWVSGQRVSVSGTYINLSLFFAFAMTYPDMEFLLFFILPIKAKWLALADAAMYVVLFIQGSLADRVCIVMSLLNVIVFFLMTRNYQRVSPTQIKRRHQFQQNVKKASAATSGPKHRCAVCGRTEQDDPNLVFRYCSKCEGNYEYCQDHLYTHTHVQKRNHN